MARVLSWNVNGIRAAADKGLRDWLARSRAEIVGIPAEPDTVTLDGQGAPVWYYENGIVEMVTPPFA